LLHRRQRLVPVLGLDDGEAGVREHTREDLAVVRVVFDEQHRLGHGFVLWAPGARGGGGTAGIVPLIRLDEGGSGGRSRGSCGRARGKVEPTPSVLSTLSVPPSSSAKRRAMARPRPVPA